MVNYELVLADGTITNVNEESNPGEDKSTLELICLLFTNEYAIDLFAAMKGGGNNFGIVTAFTVKTHPLTPQVY